MKNSKAFRQKVERVIQHICSALEAAPSPAVIDELIEAAITRAAEQSAPPTPRALIDEVAPLIRDLYARVPHIQRRLSAAQSRDEAVFLIGQCFASAPGEDFDTTLLKIRDPSLPGMEVLYRRLGERLKARLQRTHLEWVFARHLDPTDWDMNRAVTEQLLARLHPDLPPEAPALRPEAYVGCMIDLFLLVRDLDTKPISTLRDPFCSPT